MGCLALSLSSAWSARAQLDIAPAAAHSQDQTSPSTNSEEFWYHELLGEVADVADDGGLHEGTINGKPFRIRTVELEDPAARAKGYRRALRSLSERLPTEAHQWSGDEAAAGRQKIRRALGRDFTSYDEFLRWMWSNSMYFRWSVEDDHLIVDGGAKETGNL